MNESEWSEIKRTLVQAYIVLEELMHHVSWNSPESTQETVVQARNRIAEVIQDPEVDEAAQLMEYQSLAQKLEDLEMPLTDEEMNVFERFRSSQGY